MLLCGQTHTLCCRPKCNLLHLSIIWGETRVSSDACVSEARMLLDASKVTAAARMNCEMASELKSSLCRSERLSHAIAVKTSPPAAHVLSYLEPFFNSPFRRFMSVVWLDF